MVADTTPSDRVGVVGLGGLGHLAVMYARAMGCEVIVFSTDSSKKADAVALGATEFYPMPLATDTSGIGVNVMLLCGGGLPDFEMYASYQLVPSVYVYAEVCSGSCHYLHDGLPSSLSSSRIDNLLSYRMSTSFDDDIC
jgi:Zn-dependent alcohol dehydrogenase